jgi:hypothetical protein
VPPVSVDDTSEAPEPRRTLQSRLVHRGSSKSLHLEHRSGARHPSELRLKTRGESCAETQRRRRLIKTNSNQRYTTNGITGFVLSELRRRADISIQEFVVRNDCPCGSTIGPIVSANTGIRTVNAGMPQLETVDAFVLGSHGDCGL